ncbi:DNA mismatch repair endonuclease MutL [Miniphocaeibacter massiliensis]|uniref:DNA mismatch repair endonuclease MutL n=1 Tax=Miniphocaeibacter massiliensis TaxID=2041841 RepID=UPI000C0895D3|nr:DNA mismatch repair endonuclease MutL [Miniphocaeibacter massiliensis]
MIQVLSKDTILKIAAGEVIERPSSIVKELVENSIDAGSTNITVEIRNGGIDYIEVSDNGSGINKDEIEMAFQRHATSKLNNFNDLYNLSSLGFRGEALASIVSVSKVSVLTKTDSDKLGTKAVFENGKIIKSRPSAMNTGTNIQVKDLFYNVPVRKKFLKSKITEGNSITNLMYKLAIGNAGIGISYIKDDKLVFKTKEGGNLKSNLTELFGIDLSENLLELNIKDRDFKIKGFISNNKYYRANRSLQYIYINNRYIENNELRNAIENAYTAVIPNGRYPIFEIFVDIKPEHLDVNIHPNKEKVKITIIEDIIASLTEETKKILMNRFSLPSIEYKKENKENILFNQKKDIKDLLDKIDNSREVNNNFKFKEFDNHFFEKSNTVNEEENDYSENSNIEEKSNKEISYNLNESAENIEDNSIEVEEVNFIEEIEKIPSYKLIGILFNTYIIYENNIDEKIILIDQHAAHERILYEKYMKEFKSSNVIIQDLLAPITVELKDDEYSIYLENKDIFSKLGYRIEEFGDKTLIIRSVPNILGNPKNSIFFIEILDSIIDNKDKILDEIYAKIIKKSCKDAVKAGDILSKYEIDGLICRLMKCENPYTCPHGRPTLIEMTKYELEKEFMRVK